MTEHNAPNGTIYFHNAALSGQAYSKREGEQKRDAGEGANATKQKGQWRRTLRVNLKSYENIMEH